MENCICSWCTSVQENWQGDRHHWVEKSEEIRKNLGHIGSLSFFEVNIIWGTPTARFRSLFKGCRVTWCIAERQKHRCTSKFARVLSSVQCPAGCSDCRPISSRSRTNEHSEPFSNFQAQLKHNLRLSCRLIWGWTGSSVQGRARKVLHCCHFWLQLIKMPFLWSHQHSWKRFCRSWVIRNILSR